MSAEQVLAARGAVFWPVGNGDSTTIVVDETVLLQIDLHDMAKADDEETPEIAVVDQLVDALPVVDGEPYLATFALTHADKDHCLGFADLLSKVHIGELWSTPRLWREYNDPDAEDPCPDAIAFREESERRIEATKAALGAGLQPASGDRIVVVGHDEDHGRHPYEELPDQFKSFPGQALTVLDGHECAGRFEAFFHAPFRDDCAAARNETSLAMQVTLTDDSGVDGKILLFGDLAHDTIMKIFDYSEHYNRRQYLEWDLLLAPHHCSKKVMYVPNAEGNDVLQPEVLNALQRNARDQAVIVSSSNTIPLADMRGANPPHRKAKVRYSEIADEFINTMAWGDRAAPSPVVFAVDANGAAVLPEPSVELVAARSARFVALGASGARVAAVTSAAVAVAKSLPSRGINTSTGPDRIRTAVNADRGGDKAPDTPVGFGC